MECNKDEATRAMSIAESKLEQKDFIGAKKFALKAQTLYPGLYGISHMLTALDVYLAAENRLSGAVDWYGVLGVNPSADDGTIKKQYRKLALLLHPDKNNSVGADGAFKLISEAWSLLADKEKRTAYNQRRGKGFHQKVTTRPGGPSAPCRPQQHNVAGQSVPPRPSQQKVPSAPPRRSQKKAPSAPLNPSQQKVPRPSQQNRNAKVPRAPNPSPFHLRSDTFWTACRECNIYFEYLKIYCNHTLLCHICQRPFLGLETALPVSSSKSAKPVPWLGKKSSLKNLASHQNPKRNAAAAQAPGAGAGAGQTSCNSFTYVTYQEVPFPGTANTDSSRYPSTAGNVVQQQAHDNLKRSHTESHASAGLEGCYKKVKLDSDSNRFGVTSHYMADGNGDFGSESGFGAGIYGCS